MCAIHDIYRSAQNSGLIYHPTNGRDAIMIEFISNYGVGLREFSDGRLCIRILVQGFKVTYKHTNAFDKY